MSVDAWTRIWVGVRIKSNQDLASLPQPFHDELTQDNSTRVGEVEVFLYERNESPVGIGLELLDGPHSEWQEPIEMDLSALAQKAEELKATLRPILLDWGIEEPLAVHMLTSFC